MVGISPSGLLFPGRGPHPLVFTFVSSPQPGSWHIAWLNPYLTTVTLSSTLPICQSTCACTFCAFILNAFPQALPKTTWLVCPEGRQSDSGVNK